MSVTLPTRPRTLLRTVSRRAAVLGTALTLAACGDGTPAEVQDDPFTLAGTIRNVTGEPIPAGARVVVLWGVSSGSPDYTYVYGEGTVDPATSRFTVSFPDVPPAEALNAGGLGVGVVVLTTDAALKPGRLDRYDGTGLLGAAGGHAVIYVAGAGVQHEWARAFPTGYTAGKGVDLPGVFDGFTPAANGSVELIVDDLDDIDFVNWT